MQLRTELAHNQSKLQCSGKRNIVFSWWRTLTAHCVMELVQSGNINLAVQTRNFHKIKSRNRNLDLGAELTNNRQDLRGVLLVLMLAQY